MYEDPGGRRPEIAHTMVLTDNEARDDPRTARRPVELTGAEPERPCERRPLSKEYLRSEADHHKVYVKKSPEASFARALDDVAYLIALLNSTWATTCFARRTSQGRTPFATKLLDAPRYRRTAPGRRASGSHPVEPSRSR
jgi:hypothetical protein